MNKSESKYFNTAARMDEALLTLLEQKDFAYITVKEICEKAGVNRSTFYLHYETMGDLLTESIQYSTARFSEHMKPVNDGIAARLHDCPLNELYLVTPEYLRPYLGYLKEHQRLFCAMVRNPTVFQAEKAYDRLFQHIFTPILARFRVPERERAYLMAFYIRGLIAIITQWIEGDCADSVDYVISVIQHCVMQGREEQA